MVSQREEKEIIYIDRRKCGMADEDKRVLDSPDQPEEDKAQENSPPGTTWKRKSRKKPELDRSEIRITVGQLIAIKRRELKWAQEELAWQSGLSRNQIGRIERDESNPTVETIEALEEALGIELYERFMAQKRERANAFTKRKRKSPSEKMIAQLAHELEKKGISEEELMDAINRAMKSSEKPSKKKKL